MIYCRRIVWLITMMALLPGCWDSYQIQNMAYVTAIGYDYVDGQYVSYVQVLNFSNVAKTEGAELGKNIPVWIGKGEGKTVTDSLISLYQTSQKRLYWGHVKAIVFSENVLKHGIKDVEDSMLRYREFRYNVLIYGTKEPIQDILTQKSILNHSPIETIMSTPEEVYSQWSFIKPIYINTLIASLNEHNLSSKIPSLSIDKSAWHEDTKDKPMLRINGIYFINNYKLSGWLHEDDLKGYRWLQKGLIRTPISIPSEGPPTATIILRKPRFQITPQIVGEKVKYNIKVTTKAYIEDMQEPLTDQNLDKEVEKAIVSEIKDTYKKGLKQQCDVFRLEESLFRSNPQKFKEIYQNTDNKSLLTEDSLQNIDVKVHLLSSGLYKQRP
ncbi:Ger(x)C family spore germination protein [Paenibacillus sp. FA6]|uniref:Ger(x)C family spore germination protein n=1 Tax=Paenibacillus sp. FA6 TaxID=3413029 RepID=UPI003F65FD97